LRGVSPSLSRPAGHLRRLDEASVRELHAVSAILETLAVRRAASYGARDGPSCARPTRACAPPPTR
jgi:hypothetical protein